VCGRCSFVSDTSKDHPPATRYRGCFFCLVSARRASTRRRAKLRFAGWIRHGPACYRKIVSEPNYFFSCPKSAPRSPKMAPVLDHPTNNNRHTHTQRVLLLLLLRLRSRMRNGASGCAYGGTESVTKHTHNETQHAAQWRGLRFRTQPPHMTHITRCGVGGGPEIAPKGALYCTHVPLIFESVGVPILKGGAKSGRCESTGNRTVNPRRPQYSRILCAVALPDNLRLICTTTVNA
jgi:hypothetical protein